MSLAMYWMVGWRKEMLNGCRSCPQVHIIRSRTTAVMVLLFIIQMQIKKIQLFSEEWNDKEIVNNNHSDWCADFQVVGVITLEEQLTGIGLKSM